MREGREESNIERERERERESERENRERREKEKNYFFNLTTCYSKVVCLQPYCSQLPNIFRNTNLDEASFWLMRM